MNCTCSLALVSVLWDSSLGKVDVNPKGNRTGGSKTLRSSHRATENILKLLHVSQRFYEAIKTASWSGRPVLHHCFQAGGVGSWAEVLLD